VEGWRNRKCAKRLTQPGERDEREWGDTVFGIWHKEVGEIHKEMMACKRRGGEDP
jgi:hypothetical protein